MGTIDVSPLIRRLTILTKDIRLEPLIPNWAQEEYLAAVNEQLATTGKIRLIVLKARQLGLSTITEALAFTLGFVHAGYRSLVLAHENDASQNLLEMTERYWNNYPDKPLYTLRYASRNHMEWRETGSSVKVATAGNKGAGRSNTVHFLHASEVAFWPNPEVVFLGVRQTIPDRKGTGVVLESTANGVGNFFYNTWQEAAAGESEYRPLFFPWHRHPEYLASYIGIPYQSLGTYDEEERALRAMGLSDDRLAWRRHAIKNLCQNDVLKFRQEYPATPEEAFISTGTNVFPYEKLRACYFPEEGQTGYLVRDGQRVHFRHNPQGSLTIFRGPNPDTDYGMYLVAGDPTRTTQGDYAVAQVVNRRTLEQVAIWRSRIDPASFGEELFKLGLFYNTALLSNEIEGPGYTTVGKLLGMQYPNLFQRPVKFDKTPGKVTDSHGWSTSLQTKEYMIGWLLKLIVDGQIVIHSRRTFEEMKDYVTLDKGGYGPATESGYDDCVMALAQAIACQMLEPVLMPYGAGDLAQFQPNDPESSASTDSLDPVGDLLPWETWDAADPNG